MQLDSVSGTDPEALQIQLLGRFRVAVGARAIAETTWRLRKVRSLIKLLALASMHRLQREQVMDLLWPDLEPEAAANGLHQTLHVARRILDPSGAHHPSYLQLQDEILSLCPTAPLWIDVEAFEAAARAKTDEAAWTAAWAEGRAMTLDQAVAAQLQRAPVPQQPRATPEQTGPPLAATVYPASLTAREVEVRRLVASGLTDAEVAERLVLSTRTVNKHLQSIYGKLGITSRSAATRFAVDHGLA